ncbi:hypothetical protein R3P38DRAFT_3217172 [Favolaschia claudopus]|uniref:Uncharacterized protein n=1 Tax=Favolaschia claudopus TaxID=2862362 RepID=A0AAW0A668_9AGAR
MNIPSSTLEPVPVHVDFTRDQVSVDGSRKATWTGIRLFRHALEPVNYRTETLLLNFDANEEPLVYGEILPTPDPHHANPESDRVDSIIRVRIESTKRGPEGERFEVSTTLFGISFVLVVVAGNESPSILVSQGPKGLDGRSFYIFLEEKEYKTLKMAGAHNSSEPPPIAASAHGVKLNPDVIYVTLFDETLKAYWQAFAIAVMLCVAKYDAITTR